MVVVVIFPADIDANNATLTKVPIVAAVCCQAKWPAFFIGPVAVWGDGIGTNDGDNVLRLCLHPVLLCSRALAGWLQWLPEYDNSNTLVIQRQEKNHSK
jgi:hypothetical protein